MLTAEYPVASLTSITSSLMIPVEEHTVPAGPCCISSAVIQKCGEKASLAASMKCGYVKAEPEVRMVRGCELSRSGSPVMKLLRSPMSSFMALLLAGSMLMTSLMSGVLHSCASVARSSNRNVKIYRRSIQLSIMQIPIQLNSSYAVCSLHNTTPLI